jgi:glyoxylate reductase
MVNARARTGSKGKLKKVAIARRLLPAGEDPLRSRFEVVSGGLEAGRAELLEIVPGAAAIVADPTVAIDEQVLAAAGPGLELIANFAVGYDNVDREACARRGVPLTNTPGVLTNATAELALGLTLAAARQITSAETSLRDGQWTGWNPSDYRGTELSGATVGVVGMGRIGLRYAQLMAGFGGDLVYTSRSVKREAEERLGARKVSLEELLGESDVVSLHLAAAPENRHLIGKDELARMKPGAVLVNTARGTQVDSGALASALHDGELGAAGLDVFENEPGVPESLLSAPRVVLTPHIGSATFRSRDAMAELVARNVISVLEGSGPLNEVEPD